MNAFAEIDSLKTVWDGLQPLAATDERRLWQKLRLLWNYHSNHIEGNTLTYGETFLLLIHGQTHGNHTLREYEEMKAHDVGIEHLRSLAADRTREIGQGDIRDLNKIILKEPYWKPTRTPDGQQTRAQVIPGEYKTLPNSVITPTGELFEYTAPMEVPAKMQALVDWLAEALREKREHILHVAAKLHHDFVLIHPFDDGNGRVARMLVNYVLLRAGYPPIIVPTEQKAAYLMDLRLADAGDTGPLAEFFSGHLEWSLRLAIRAGRGESIEEPGDVEKEVALFVRSQQARNGKGKMPTQETLMELAKISIHPFIAALMRKMETLKPLFLEYHLLTQHFSEVGGIITSLTSMDSFPEKAVLIPGGEIRMLFQLNKYKGEAPTSFSQSIKVGIHFPPGKYTITRDQDVLLSKSYSELILSHEIDQVSAQILSKAFEAIRRMAGSHE